MSTNVLSIKDVRRGWHLIDAKGEVLGRLATKAATLLSGKNKSNFVPYLDNGDNVVVVNAKEIKVTGRKLLQKKYVRHSGYPGGLRVETLSSLQERRPEEVIKHAIYGMLPKTKLGRTMRKKLYIFAGKEHNLEDKFKGEK